MAAPGAAGRSRSARRADELKERQAAAFSALERIATSHVQRLREEAAQLGEVHVCNRTCSRAGTEPGGTASSDSPHASACQRARSESFEDTFAESTAVGRFTQAMNDGPAAAVGPVPEHMRGGEGGEGGTAAAALASASVAHSSDSGSFDNTEPENVGFEAAKAAALAGAGGASHLVLQPQATSLCGSISGDLAAAAAAALPTPAPSALDASPESAQAERASLRLELRSVRSMISEMRGLRGKVERSTGATRGPGVGASAPPLPRHIPAAVRCASPRAFCAAVIPDSLPHILRRACVCAEATHLAAAHHVRGGQQLSDRDAELRRSRRGGSTRRQRGGRVLVGVGEARAPAAGRTGRVL